MNKYLILLILFIIIYFNKKIFEYFLPNNFDDDYIQFNENSPSNNCCLVEKQFVYSRLFKIKGNSHMFIKK